MIMIDKKENTETKLVTYNDMNNVEVKLSVGIIKKYLGGGLATNQEIVMFLNLCRAQRLNPFLREAYLIKYYEDDPAQIVVGKDTFTKRATSHKDCAGFNSGVIVLRDGKEVRTSGMVLKDDVIIGGWGVVYRKDWVTPLEVTVSMHEYNKGHATWNKIPATMIRKVALVQALREAFPDVLGGLYDSAEINKVDSAQLESEPIEIETIEETANHDADTQKENTGSKIEENEGLEDVVQVYKTAE